MDSVLARAPRMNAPPTPASKTPHCRRPVAAPSPAPQTVAYDGTAFAGFQWQAGNVRTVQGELEKVGRPGIYWLALPGLTCAACLTAAAWWRPDCAGFSWFKRARRAPFPRQTNAPPPQAAARVMMPASRAVGASRTDGGAHAVGQVGFDPRGLTSGFDQACGRGWSRIASCNRGRVTIAPLKHTQQGESSHGTRSMHSTNGARGAVCARAAHADRNAS